MTTHDNLAVAAGLSADAGRWQEQFDELMARIAGRLARAEPRRRARAFVPGLLSGLRRRNCWIIAGQAGDLTPDGMQHLLAAARWDADVKKGRASAGVQRRDSGTAGRAENCQVAVFLSCASPAGHALIDRELYLPRSWTADPARCAAAAIAQDTAFAAKPGLARRMIARALDAGCPAARVTGDEVYGADPGLRADPERRQIGYVLAAASSHQVSTAAGPRCQDWAWAAIDPGRPGRRHLLIRRNRRTGELAFCRCCSPRPVPLPVLVKAAGTRWTTEENFQGGKELTGSDEHQVRRWDSWYRRTTLAMLALAFLSVTAATGHADHPAPAGPIPLTRNEIAALFSTLVIKPVTGTPHRLHWPAWRRRHQHRARTSHYQRQARQP